MIVCNAGPLIALAGIGQVELLQRLFGTVVVAEPVRREVEAGGASKQGGNLFHAHDWLRTTTVAEPPDQLLSALLDLGEASTIALALQLKATHVLMDESKGRKIARSVYHLHVVGTGRILVEAKKAGFIASVKPLLHQMRMNGYWLSQSIADQIVHQAGE